MLTPKISMNCQITLVCNKSEIIDSVGICVFLHDSLICRLRPHLSINSDAMEAFFIEIINKNFKNILVSTHYRHPSSKGRIFEEYLKIFFSKTKVMTGVALIKVDLFCI